MKYFALVLALTLGSFLGSIAQAAPVETMSLPFGLDNKSWELGWSKETPQEFMYEFVPKGQTVENWKELVTLQFYPQLKGSAPSDFVKEFLGRLQSAEPLAKITPISSLDNDVLLEWNVLNSRQNADQFELDRVMRGKQGLHMIHYAVKTNKLSAAEHDKWLGFLKSAKLNESK